jgi:hypothetical protein
MSTKIQGRLLLMGIVATALVSAAFAQPHGKQALDPGAAAATEVPALEYPTLRRRIHERAERARAASATVPAGPDNGAP